MQVGVALIYYSVAVVYFVLAVYAWVMNVKASDKNLVTLGTLCLSLCCFALTGLEISQNKTRALVYMAIVGTMIIMAVAFFLHSLIKTTTTVTFLDKITKVMLVILYISAAAFSPIYYYLIRTPNGDLFGKSLILSVDAEGHFLISGSLEAGKIFYMILLLLAIAFAIRKIIKRYYAEFLMNNKRFFRMAIIWTVIGFVVVLMDLFLRFFIQGDYPAFAIIFFIILVGHRIYVYRQNYKEVSYNETIHQDDLYIIDEHRKRSLYSYVSYGIIVSGFIGIAVNYIYDRDYGPRFVLSMAYTIVVGVVVVWVQHKVARGLVSDAISNIMWASSLPVSLTSFPHASVTVLWAIPCLTLLGCVFVDRIFIILFGVSGVITYALLMIEDPYAIIQFDIARHLFRLIIFLGIIAIILLIHRNFVKRLTQIKNHEYFQMAVLNISQWLVSSQQMDLLYRITEVLRSIVNYTDADRAFVYRLTNSNTTFSLISAFQREDAEIKLPRTIKVYEMSDKINSVINDKRILIFDQMDEREYQFLQLDADSTIYVPMTHKENTIGMLCIQNRGKIRSSTFDEQLLKIMSNMISNAIMTSEIDQAMERNSNFDRLTQLPNRTHFTRILDEAIIQSDESTKLVIVFMDLDGFQSINDVMGHEYGDQVLIEVAQRLISNLTRRVTISRFGGDEFLLLFREDMDSEKIVDAMEKIKDIFVEPIMIDGKEIHITMSCGVAVYPYDGADSSTLIKNADMAMNNAKQLGKNTYSLCSDEMKNKVEYRALLQEHLRSALDNNEFKLVYQPHVDARSHRIKGAEALLRWFPKNCPKLGNFVSPAQFIPVLEETGLIIEVGRFVIEESIKVAGKIKNLGIDDIVIAMNISVEQFKDFGLTGFIEGQMRKYGITGANIDVEITESAYADEHDAMGTLMEDFNRLGVSISIDDFGTGYSNMNRLSHISIDKIKIDMSYVRGIGVNEKDEGITTTIINLADSLGCTTLAEGVETAEQLAFLAANGCDLIQGYYFYKPLSEEEFFDTISREYDKGEYSQREVTEIGDVEDDLLLQEQLRMQKERKEDEERNKPAECG